MITLNHDTADISIFNCEVQSMVILKLNFPSFSHILESLINMYIIILELHGLSLAKNFRVKLETNLIAHVVNRSFVFMTWFCFFSLIFFQIYYWNIHGRRFTDSYLTILGFLSKKKKREINNLTMDGWMVKNETERKERNGKKCRLNRARQAHSHTRYRTDSYKYSAQFKTYKTNSETTDQDGFGAFLFKLS